MPIGQIALAQRLLLPCLNLRVCEASGATLAGLEQAVAESKLHANAQILLPLRGTRCSGHAGGSRRHGAPILESPADRLQEVLPLVLRYAEGRQTPEQSVS